MDDSQILELYFNRSEDAIRETEKKYRRLCLDLSYNILGSFSDSEECVNDTYLAVWNAIPPARPANFKLYICKVVRNLSLKKYAYNTAAKRNAEALFSLSEIEDVIADSRFAPDAEDNQLAEIINEFLRSISQEKRKVFVRRYFFFDSIGDIAAKYGYSNSKVENMLYRTRNKLKQRLKEEGVIL